MLHGDRSERGIGMIVVVLVLGVAFMISVLAVRRGQSGLGQAVGDRRWQGAIHVAEAGIDDTMSRLWSDRTWNTGVSMPAFASEDEERLWVLERAGEGPAEAVEGGQWSVVKPDNAEVIYAVGYVPSRAVDDKVRVVRVSYDFAPYAPIAAIITGGNLTISGNPTLQGSHGSAHSNGSLTVSGSVSSTSFVSATGAYDVGGSPDIGDPANSGGGKPQRLTPEVSPRDHYGFSEYDLCPDGLVRGGPSFTGPEANATAVPCQGGVLADANVHAYRGWRKSGDDASKGAVWRYNGNQAFDGTYYVLQGSISIAGAPGSQAVPWEATILTEGSAAGAEPHCPHTGGDIEIIGSPVMRPTDEAQPLLLIADRDLVLGGASAAAVDYQGFMSAHEQLKITGNPNVEGALVAEGTCNSAGSPVASSSITGSPTITFNASMELPSGDIPRATLWTEL